MLLDANLITKPAPKVVWLGNLKPDVEPAQSTPRKSRRPASSPRRLRRMQRQNFIERAVTNIVELFVHAA